MAGIRQTADTVTRVTDQLIDFFVTYGMQIVGGLIILTVGFMLARWVGGAVQGALKKKEMEPPVRTLIVRLIRLAIFGFTLVLALEKVGVPIAPLVAGIGVVGVGVGLATQGVLGNVVAGLTIIFTKPFRVGEFVELAGVRGQVENIELFSTILIHGDLSRVIVPNRKIVGEILHNYGSTRQLDITVAVAYETDLSQAFRVIQQILDANPHVLKQPPAVIGVSNLGEYAVMISVKPWAKLADFGPAQIELNQAILERFRENKIEIPIPQRQIRVLSDSGRAAVTA